MVFDRTCRGARMRPGLSHAWWLGGHLYRGLRRFDAHRGVASWAEALEWMADLEPSRAIAEVQFWGHGKWGNAKVDRDVLDREALVTEHRLHSPLARIAERMQAGAEGLWWFRTCETFGAGPGLAFAPALAEFLGCRVAGHTFIIGHWQSGLHSLLPGETPTWSDTEGLREGTVDDPRRAYWSGLRQPNTISCLHGKIPAGY